MLESLLVSTGVVALAEMGDKTQLLALMLAARYRARLPIVAGIAVATLANHALAAALGSWLAAQIGEQALRWGLATSFFAMAAWMLVPDKPDEGGAQRTGLGVFGTTLVAFFIVEMGDKTQIATVALAAHYGSFAWILVGTTLGMLIANVPAVYAGEALLRRVPVLLLQRVAAASFVVLGVLALLT